MTLTEYLAQRRNEIEERIAAETLAGNEFKLAAEKAALAELNGVEQAIQKGCYYKISTDEHKITFDAHGMSASEALVAIIQAIAVETYRKLNEDKK